jgi:glycosyltransferase involved in cell wall biosynthesis
MIELSVVIPTYNRAVRLQASLEALGRQTLPAGDFEVIVVDDGSTDGTREMLGHLRTAYRLRAVSQPNSGQNVARNRGADLAQGRYCVFLDDDIVAQPRLLAEHLRAQREHGDVVGIGAIPTVVPADAGWFSRHFAEAWNEHYAKLGRGVRLPSWRYCYGGNVSVPRAAFLAVGGFASDMRRGHDVELGYRLAEHGLAFVYVADAVGTQHERKGLRELVSDFENYGAAAAELSRRHPPTLPHVIQDFGRRGAGPVWLRRLLLGLGIPSRLLAPLGAFGGTDRWARKWYRFIQSYCYWRGVRRTVSGPDRWWQLTHGTPILRYRELGAAGRPASRDVVPMRRFTRQMAWLKWAGYHVLDVDQYLQHRRDHRLPAMRSVVVVIDDAHAALPPDHGWTEIHGTESLPQFAWKVWRASSGAPSASQRGAARRAAGRRILQVTR